MKNTPYNISGGLDLPRDIQLQRLRRVIEQELTPRQRQMLEAYYFENLRPAAIARRHGIHRSTVMRTIQRAENRLRRYLTY